MFSFEKQMQQLIKRNQTETCSFLLRNSLKRKKTGSYCIKKTQLQKDNYESK